MRRVELEEPEKHLETIAQTVGGTACCTDQQPGRCCDREELAMPVEPHVVRLAYELLLGRKAENEEIVESHSSNFTSVEHVRQEFMQSEEFQAQARFIQWAEQLYFNDQRVRSRTCDFDNFLSTDEATDAAIMRSLQSAIADPALSAAEIEYSIFHRRRFSIQLRAMVAARRKLLSIHPRIRVLEIGYAPIASYYGEVMPDMDFYTADIPSSASIAEKAARSKSLAHYPIDFEVDDISEKHPQLVVRPFHLILFCEVIEHVRAAPEEIISDLLRIVSPDGVIVLSTPNAMDQGRLLEIFNGRKADTTYRKAQRFLHCDRHVHVREFTIREMEDATVLAGGRVLAHGVHDCYGDTNDFVRARFVGARHAQTLLITRA
jgi:SAM-dependent methyltransferase